MKQHELVGEKVKGGMVVHKVKGRRLRLRSIETGRIRKWEPVGDYFVSGVTASPEPPRMQQPEAPVHIKEVTPSLTAELLRSEGAVTFPRLDNKRKADLQKIADSFGIEYTTKFTKADIIDLILEKLETVDA